MRKLGVLDLDTFYPPADRSALALKLNGLLASPSFAAWNQGRELDIETLLRIDGRPQAAIVSVAHLSEAERMFVVTLVLSRMVTWTRQPSQVPATCEPSSTWTRSSATCHPPRHRPPRSPS